MFFLDMYFLILDMYFLMDIVVFLILGNICNNFLVVLYWNIGIFFFWVILCLDLDIFCLVVLDILEGFFMLLE